ncbi:MAG: endopeptidase La [Candidatus Hatepunaea meridiana]|nr:endopeptidase La [Candidatus Hatepunaea meridiana]
MSKRKKKEESSDIPLQLPLLLTNDLVVFPGIINPFLIQDKDQVNLINEVLASENKLLTVALKKPKKDKKERLEEPYDIGCAALVVKMARVPDGSIRLLMQGIGRVKLGKIEDAADDMKVVNISRLKTPPSKGIRIEALMRNLKESFNEIIDKAQYLPVEMKVALLNIENPGALADFLASNLNVKADERQEILSAVDIETRLTKVSRLVIRELELINLGTKIQDEVTSTIEKNQREYFLREQLKAIRRELGEDQEGSEISELVERLQQLKASDKVKEVAEKEIERLRRMNPSAADYNVSRNYVDWIFDLPWEISTEDRLDIGAAREILDRDHYGLDDVKDRILEYLAVKKLKPEGKGSILCFIGPPGVGKTSIGKSISSALGRKFQRMSLGGMRDEAEIRGHRRTYIGALPGRIIQNLKRAGTNNPVFMLDEIDKLGADFRGDPASAMLEVLDPEQNFAFQDNYLELDFDLSKVMFITTANYLDTIPPPLRDRMEIIKLSGYITPEKVEIARRYLLPRQIDQNGLTNKQITVTDKALEQIVIYYTREAGVRKLEQTIGKVCRKIAVNVAAGEEKKFNVSIRNLQDYLGAPKVSPELFNRKPQVGIATGLAWTPVGGVMLRIEAISMPGKGNVKITGRLGDVMKESASIAMSLIKHNAEKLKIPQEYFETNDFHLHIPEGATPKDGPSAGITLTTALASLFTKRPIRHDIAMTGEITLEGRVLPIGGLREKCVAAARGRMKMVICPADNKVDMEEIPDVIKEKLEFKFVDKIEEVLKTVLLRKV